MMDDHKEEVPTSVATRVMADAPELSAEASLLNKKGNRTKINPFLDNSFGRR